MKLRKYFLFLIISINILNVLSQSTIIPLNVTGTPPSSYPLGAYLMSTESDSPYSWIYDAGVLFGFKPTNGYYRHVQFISSHNGNAFSLRTKNGNNDEWLPWQRFLIANSNGIIDFKFGYLSNKSVNNLSSSIDNIFDHKSYDLLDLGGQAGSGNQITAIKLTTAIGSTTYGTRLIQENSNFRIQCGSGSNNPNSIVINGGNGSVGIGTTNTYGHKLAVDGSILATEVQVKLRSDWSDFVFNPDYNLRTLDETEQFIAENGHLPDIPSAKQVAAEGISLGEMDAKLLQKIEELTLYNIEMNKKLEQLMEKNENMQMEIENLKTK